MISKEDINKIQEASKIEELVSEYVNLKKRGSNYIGLCPFHNEKTPSFVVSPAKNIYKCFGCGAAGGSINFIMDHEQYTYPEALKFLARKFNIDISEAEETDQDRKNIDDQQLAYIINELAAKYYKDKLHNAEEGRSFGLTYFRNRGFSDKVIEIFGLGYSLVTDSGFTEYAISLGYKLEDIVDAGLANNVSYANDRFKGRVMFPIYSISGRVVGFGARAIANTDKTAKYLNSPETKIYKKSHLLYGLNLAKKAIIKNDNCFVVEGYTDVISLYQSGVENVVSSSGTSLTDDQIRIIQRYTKNITIVFDGDKAGVIASLRGIDMILANGLNVRVVVLPENEDPDSFAQKNRDSNVIDYFNNNTESFIAFKTKILFEHAGKDPIKRAEAIKEVVASIVLVDDAITRTLLIRECSALVDLPELTLSNEVSKHLKTKVKNQGTAISEPVVSNKYKNVEQSSNAIFKEISFTYLEKRIAGLLLNFSKNEIIINHFDENGVEHNTSVSVENYIVNSLNQDDIEIKDTYSRNVFQEFERNLESNENIQISNLINTITDVEYRKFIIELISVPYTLSPNWSEELNVVVLTTESESVLLKKEVFNTILMYKLYRVRERVELMQKELEETSNIDLQSSLLQKINSYQQVMREIAVLLGGIVVIDF